MNKLLLFDIDGTLVESGEKILPNMVELLNSLQKKGYELGIVGGGKLDKILYQLDNKIYFSHYFTECGCVYNKNDMNIHNFKLEEIYKKNIRNHLLYQDINILIKIAMNFISNVEYTITGHFIDLRNGIIYISLIGMSATIEERKTFLYIDSYNNYKEELLHLLINKATELNIINNIDIVYGGSVGIAIYPKEYDKIQVLDHIDREKYTEIHYFGDKYLQTGNDYKLLNNENIIGHNIDSLDDTVEILKHLNNLN